MVDDPYELKTLEKNSNQFKELKNRLTQHIRASGAVSWQKAVYW